MPTASVVPIFGVAFGVALVGALILNDLPTDPFSGHFVLDV